MQDFVRGQRLLGEAEALLRIKPVPELQADVYLAYSSLSFTLNKFETSAIYAQRGLDALSGDIELPTRARLLRNRARAESKLNQPEAARESLAQAHATAARFDDPKLSAELFLEAARLGHAIGDVRMQEASGNAVLALGLRLKNSQLSGQAHEVLGIAALDHGDQARAQTELTTALASFQKLKLERDELRVLRVLVTILLAEHGALESVADTKVARERLAKYAERLLKLGQKIEEADRAKAASDFDAQLKFATSEIELKQLKTEASAALERENLLRGNTRLAQTVAALIALSLLILIGFFLQMRRNKRALETSERRMRAVTDHIPALVAQIDSNERYVFANPAIAHTFSAPLSEINGKTLRELHGAEAYARLEPHIRRALRGEYVSFEDQSRRDDKEHFYQCSLVPDVDTRGNTRGFFALNVDITELKLAEKQLERLARVDALTGIANRRQFEERMSHALQRSKRQQSGIALLCFDIDKFKNINDTHGHAVGDQVIQQFAKRISSAVREGDLPARMGGDEFVVLLEDVSTIENAEIVAQKIVTMMQTPMQLGNVLLPVTTSIGVTFTAVHAEAAELLENADKALYAAKAAGRNTYRSTV
jgi:diguanylate cyclase (GGDEF)-like protein/PAS domain S-box-containing protein